MEHHKGPQKKAQSLIISLGFLFTVILKHNLMEQNIYLYNNFLSSEAPRLFISVTLKPKVSGSDKILSF